MLTEEMFVQVAEMADNMITATTYHVPSGRVFTIATSPGHLETAAITFGNIDQLLMDLLFAQVGLPVEASYPFKKDPGEGALQSFISKINKEAMEDGGGGVAEIMRVFVGE